MDTDEIYDPGDTVTINGMEAIINCVALYANGGTSYEVVWWKDGDRYSSWVSVQELNSSPNKKKDYTLK